MADETTTEYLARKAAEKAEREAFIARTAELVAEEYAKLKAEGRVASRRDTADRMTVAEAKSLAASIAISRIHEERSAREKSPRADF